jgi:hypothetical protein
MATAWFSILEPLATEGEGGTAAAPGNEGRLGTGRRETDDPTHADDHAIRNRQTEVVKSSHQKFTSNREGV